MKLVKFTSPHGRFTWINPEHVVAVWQHNTEDEIVRISVVAGFHEVKGDAQAIAIALRAGTRAP